MDEALRQSPRMDFSEPSEFRTLALIVEDKKLWVCRDVLALWSPVFKNMFCGDFKEAKASEIPLPGKRFDDMVELMEVLTPPIMKPVDWNNVKQLLDLSREYMIDALQTHCYQFLELSLRRKEKSDRDFEVLLLACKYGLYDLMELCIHKVVRFSSDYIYNRRKELPVNVAFALMEAKFSRLRHHTDHVGAKKCDYCNRRDDGGRCSQCKSNNPVHMICGLCGQSLCFGCYAGACPSVAEHDDCDCKVDCYFDTSLLRPAAEGIEEEEQNE